MRMILSIVACFSFSATARSADWKPVIPADKSFTAEMPAEPKLLNRLVNRPEGPIRQVVHYTRFDGALYTIQTAETPPRGSLDSRKSAVKLVRADYLKNDSGKILEEKAVMTDGLPGWDMVLKSPAIDAANEMVTSRVRLLVGDRVRYTLMVIAAKDKPLPTDADRFFDSFHPVDQGKAPANKPGQKAAATPEETLRSFFLAWMMADEAKVREFALPADGLDELWKGVPFSPEEAALYKQQMAQKRIRTLKPGDEFTLPGNRKDTVPAEDVTEDRAVLLLDGAPSPIRMRKVNGQWKVDASPMLDPRKAAAAKAKAEAKKAGK